VHRLTVVQAEGVGDRQSKVAHTVVAQQGGIRATTT
jgi:hypothetical protein